MATPKSPRRPNILWVSFEDTNPRYGCYGDPLARSPNVDRLASMGCRYPNAFSVAGVCAPSRSAIITGMYPTFIGTHHMRTTHQNRESPEMPTPYSAVIPHYVRPFPELLRRAGYFCTNNIKTDYQFTPAFTTWDVHSDTAHWRNRKDKSQPFFAVFNPTMTHESGMWPEKTHEVKTDPDKVEVPPYLVDTPETRKCIARQYDNIERDDDLLGRLMKDLEEDGELDNTIIVHWSDHGEGLPRGKRWPYDRGINIPLIVAWPGTVDAGTVSEEMVSLIDLGPTMLAAAGVDIPAHLQGRPFVGPAKRDTREYIFATRDRHDEHYDMIRAVRDKRFKYLRNYTNTVCYEGWMPYRNKLPAMADLWRGYIDGTLNDDQMALFRERPSEELYDTDNDPWELNNLAKDPHFASDLERLRSVLDDWRADYDRYSDMSEFEMVRQWHPDGTPPVTAVPKFAPVTHGNIQAEIHNDGGTFTGPVRLQLHCATQGAQIGYTFDEGDDPQWQCYWEPLNLGKGTHRIRIKAIRIGYEESAEQAATFTVE